MTKQMCAKLTNAGKSFDIMIMGDKGRAQLRSAYGDKFSVIISDRVAPYNFELACCLAQEIVEKDYEGIHLVYNEFKSAIKYVPSIKTIIPLLEPTHANLNDYHVYPRKHQETLLSLLEYTLATQIYHSLLENAASEQSSRMGAMENATKNAGEMIEKLTLKYNRARQARITTELIEIISGASAISG
jgi:F-type H+-transporting ATPase subunit gamma